MKRILVVDDNPDLRELYARFLDDEGYSVSLASDGAEAIDVAQKVHPDAIVMDVSMPGGMDGCETAWLLRGGDETADIPIVAVTGEPLDALESSSFDNMLEKPCDPDELAHVLAAMTTPGPEPDPTVEGEALATPGE